MNWNCWKCSKMLLFTLFPLPIAWNERETSLEVLWNHTHYTTHIWLICLLWLWLWLMHVTNVALSRNVYNLIVGWQCSCVFNAIAHRNVCINDEMCASRQALHSHGLHYVLSVVVAKVALFFTVLSTWLNGNDDSVGSSAQRTLSKTYSVKRLTLFGEVSLFGRWGVESLLCVTIFGARKNYVCCEAKAWQWSMLSYH